MFNVQTKLLLSGSETVLNPKSKRLNFKVYCGKEYFIEYRDMFIVCIASFQLLVVLILKNLKTLGWRERVIL